MDFLIEHRDTETQRILNAKAQRRKGLDFLIEHRDTETHRILNAKALRRKGLNFLCVSVSLCSDKVLYVK